MERYECMEEVGSGTFSVVHKAIHKDTGEVVAVKKLKTKYDTWEECMNLPEVKAIKEMHNHPNFVEVKEIIKQKDSLYIVFEYMECSLNQAMAQQEKPFSETVIRYLCFQILQGLAYMHHKDFFHHDLKPDNLLMKNDAIKIADLGSARDVNGRPLYTHYITTRCYHAPEVILCSPVYDCKVDMWAMGGIMSELLTLETLFPGESGAEVMHNICVVLGTPTETTWPEGLFLASNIKYQFPDFHGVKLSNILPSAIPDLLNLISGLLLWDPSKSLTASEALQHPFFNTFYHISRPLCYEHETVDHSLIPGPPGFKFPLQREFLKETNNLETKSFSSSSKGEHPFDFLTEEFIQFLPEHLFEDSTADMYQFPPENPFDFSTQDIIDFPREHPSDFEDSTSDIARLLPEHPFEDAIEDMITFIQENPSDFEDSTADIARLLPEHPFEDAIEDMITFIQEHPSDFEDSTSDIARLLPEHPFEDAIEDMITFIQENPSDFEDSTADIARLLPEHPFEDAIEDMITFIQEHPSDLEDSTADIARLLPEHPFEDAIEDMITFIQEHPSDLEDSTADIARLLPEHPFEDAIEDMITFIQEHPSDLEDSTADIARLLPEHPFEDAIEDMITFIQEHPSDFEDSTADIACLLPEHPFEDAIEDMINLIHEHPSDFEDSTTDIVRLLPEHPFEDTIEDMINLMQFDV